MMSAKIIVKSDSVLSNECVILACTYAVSSWYSDSFFDGYIREISRRLLNPGACVIDQTFVRLISPYLFVSSMILTELECDWYLLHVVDF